MARLFTVLHFGCDRLAAGLGSVEKNGKVSVSAIESLSPRGIKNGSITDMAAAVEDISSLLARLGRENKRPARGVHVAVTGTDLEAKISRGATPLSRIPREITGKDVKKCIEVAGLVKLSPERAVIDKITRGYSVDSGEANIASPLGLYGVKLEAELMLITASASRADTISKALDHAGFFVEKFYLANQAKSQCLLGENDTGETVLLDVGEGMSEAAVYRDKKIREFRAIKKGKSFFIKNDGALDREKLKSFLGEVFRANSLVITGHGALVDGMIEEAERVTGIPARLGVTKRAGMHLTPEDSIVHAATIGLLNRIAEEYTFFHAAKNPLRRALHRLIDIYESYF